MCVFRNAFLTVFVYIRFNLTKIMSHVHRLDVRVGVVNSLLSLLCFMSPVISGTFVSESKCKIDFLFLVQHETISAYKDFIMMGSLFFIHCDLLFVCDVTIVTSVVQ